MTGSAFDTTSRLDTLEARFAHQERVIGDLNEVITAQWRQIETLQRQVRQLREEFQSLGPPGGAPEPPPPHY